MKLCVGRRRMILAATVRRASAPILDGTDLCTSHVGIRIIWRSLRGLRFESFDLVLQAVAELSCPILLCRQILSDTGVFVFIDRCGELSLMEVVDAIDLSVKISCRGLNLLNLCDSLSSLPAERQSTTHSRKEVARLVTLGCRTG